MTKFLQNKDGQKNSEIQNFCFLFFWDFTSHFKVWNFFRQIVKNGLRVLTENNNYVFKLFECSGAEQEIA
jgi:hypothetical protein